MDSVVKLFNERVMNRKKLYVFAFLFTSFILIAEKQFIGIPKKAVLFVSLIVFLIIFFWNEKIEKNVLLISMTFGILFSVMSPIYEVWDEPAHFTRVVHISEGNFYLTNERDNQFVSKDVNKLEEISRYTSRRKEVLPNTFETELWNYKHNSEKEEQFRVNVTSAYGTIAYLPSTLGYMIGKIISNNNLGVMFYLGRIFNAIFYALCAYLAVKLSGKWKHIMAFFALQPLMVYVSGSFNQDAISYGLLLIVVALFFKMIQNENEKVVMKDIVIYTLLCVLMAFTKLPYIVLAGLIFFIPFKKFDSRKTYFVMIGGILLVIAVSAFWFKTYLQIEGIVPTAENVDVKEQVKFMLENKKEALGIIFTGMFNTIGKYKQLTAFAWDYQVSNTLALVNLICIGIVFGFPMKDIDKVSKWTKFGVIVISLIITVFIYLSMYLTWTTVGLGHVLGVQGRYFAGVVLILPIALNFSKYIGEVKENSYTINTLQVVSFLLLIWTLASRIGVYY